MWVIYSLLSALFGGMNGILAKFSLRKNDPAVVTALRTVVVLLIAWGAVALGGVWQEIAGVSGNSLLLLLLSGVLTALAWLFYFRAMESGSVNRVAAVDKFSTVLTLLGGWLFLGESMKAVKILSMAIITVGILLMIQKESTTVDNAKNDYSDRRAKGCWFLWSVLSVLAVSSSALLSKSGVEAVDPRLALVIRTSVVLILSASAVWWKCLKHGVWSVERKTMPYIALSGAATGFGWLFLFRGLTGGDAGIVYSLDKLSIFVTAVLAKIFLGERLTLLGGIGLLLLSIGIVLLILV